MNNIGITKEPYDLHVYAYNLFICKKWDGNNIDEIKKIIDRYYKDKLFVKLDGSDGWLTIFKMSSGDYLRSYHKDDYIHIYPFKYWDPLGMRENGNDDEIIKVIERNKYIDE